MDSLSAISVSIQKRPKLEDLRSIVLQYVVLRKRVTRIMVIHEQKLNFCFEIFEACCHVSKGGLVVTLVVAEVQKLAEVKEKIFFLCVYTYTR
jgi:hypothetical protein